MEAPSYADIVDRFGFDPAADRAAAEELSDLLDHDLHRMVGQELKHRPRAIVVGCGPSLDDHDPSTWPEGVVVAADGSTAWLRERGILPRVVVTDLDGDPEGLDWAAKNGSMMVVHAHGDNRDRIARMVPTFSLVAGTGQGDVSDVPRIRGTAGFTDGDRAALLCADWGVKEILLVAFDLDDEPGRWSHAFDPGVKRAKLAIAKAILAAAVQAGAPIAHLPPGSLR